MRRGTPLVGDPESMPGFLSPLGNVFSTNTSSRRKSKSVEFESGGCTSPAEALAGRVALGKSLAMLSCNVYPSWAFLLTCKMWRWPQLPSSDTGRDRGEGHLQAETVFRTHDSLPERLSLGQGPVPAVASGSGSVQFQPS